MRTLRWFLCALPLFALGCEDPETAPAPARVADLSTPPTAEQTDVDVVIQGAGTVEFDHPDLFKLPPKCTAPDGNGAVCDIMRFDGDAAVTASPADGWRFVRWENGAGVVAPVVITNPTSPIQHVPRGDSVHLVAVFECIVHPITANFVDEAMATQYSVDVDSLPEEAGISVQWSGPTCGAWNGQAQLGTTGRAYTMTWQHPHPPCDATTDHHEVTVRVTIRINDQIIVCEYQGAKSGEGPACK